MGLLEPSPYYSGYRMPAEWEPHARCWMIWPSREEFWQDIEATKQGFADVALAIREFEPVNMIVNPGQEDDVRQFCGCRINPVVIENDDSWSRDSGPTFLTHPKEGIAGTAWRFNAWGNKHQPWFKDAKLATRLLNLQGMKCYSSPLVFEGGGLTVDGTGSVIVTESVILNENRNPGITKVIAEDELRQALGVENVIWLPGDWDEYETDGHVDGIACFVREGVVMHAVNHDPACPYLDVLRENQRALELAKDAKGRRLELIPIHEASESKVVGDIFCQSYINFYIANGGIVAPKYNIPQDKQAQEVIQRAFPNHQVSMVDVNAIAPGGGGIHCITQQQPASCTTTPK